MLAHFVRKAKSGGSQVSLQAVMSMLSDVTHVEQRAMLNAADEAHIGKVYMMEEGLAAAFGAGVVSSDKRASAVIDFGAGTTNIAVVAKGTVVHSRSERIGSNPIVESIVRRIAQTVSDTLTELKAEVAADIFDRGVILTGGGAHLDGIDQYLRSFINLPVTISDEPRYATVRGLLKMFDEPELLEKVSRNELSLLQNSEIPFEA
jgi:actin-like ATPase involved in cell morphogenesis